jgi:D-glycero-D-manno-heptose 1,7-bisphosphate phosphatase
VVSEAGGRRAVFLDRDGVLVIPEFRDGRSFAPRSLADFKIYPDAADCLRHLKAAGFALIVVTNQPDVGNGVVAQGVVEEMHRRVAAALPVDDIEVCYHRQDEQCVCRKPKPGMLLRAAQHHSIDCRRSIMIGDRGSDVAAGKAVGCVTILIDLGDRDGPAQAPDFTVGSLAAATAIALRMV